jgi:hypothetical protein
MMFLIHLLEHLGLPSAAAIGMVISAKKLLTRGAARIGTHHHRDDRDRDRSHSYR